MYYLADGEAVYDNPRTVITREYPVEQADGNEAYYPINDERNNAIYQAYRQLAEREQDILFGGRLAEYWYYDMDGVIASAMRGVEGEGLRSKVDALRR